MAEAKTIKLAAPGVARGSPREAGAASTSAAAPGHGVPSAAQGGERPVKIIGIVCNWCSYAGADTAGVGRYKQPANLRLLRVPCTGRIDPLFALKAFEKGADGVLISGCHPGDCHYSEGNYLRPAQVRTDGADDPPSRASPRNVSSGPGCPPPKGRAGSRSSPTSSRA